MLRLLQFLIFGHIHKWKEVSRENLTQRQHGALTKIGQRVYTDCETCGAHKSWDLY